jgi:hypothetical protein
VLQIMKPRRAVSSAGLPATEHQRALRSACVARAPLPTISSPSQPKMRARCSPFFWARPAIDLGQREKVKHFCHSIKADFDGVV